MSKKIERQFMDLFRDSKDGFLVTEGEKVLYINNGACELFKCDNGQKNLSDLFDDGMEGEKVINGRTCSINTVKLDDSSLIFVHAEAEFEKYKRETEYKSACIFAISQYQKQLLDDVAIMLGANIDDGAYKRILQNTHRRIFKSNTTITELTRNISGKSKNIRCYSIAPLFENIVKNIGSVLPDLNVKIKNAVQNHLVYCEIGGLEQTVYSAISALAYQNKQGCEIVIDSCYADGKAVITIEGKGVKWCAEQVGYVNKERKEHLHSDVHKYGYDILRAVNLIEWQEGECTVNLGEDATTVAITLYDREISDNELLVFSENEGYMTVEEVTIALSDIL